MRNILSHLRKDFLPDIWSLLKHNIYKGQLLGYSLANVVGLTVILTGLLFWLDSRHSNLEEDMFFSRDYVVISKKVDGIKFDPISFSEDEIKKLQQQPWVKKIGRFTSSQFAVKAAVNMGGRELSTYMFFESVPDNFFDVKPKDWYFNPEEKFVPIIISKDYLTLYNFGFAIPQGMPQVSEEIISSIPITLRLTGESNEPEFFEAAIVGFSSRLNTIAVPQQFMEWANSRYYTGTPPNPSRLIVQIDRLASADMEAYLHAQEMEISADQSTASQISDFLSLASLVITTNGVVISLLALFILILSIYLLLQKSRGKLRNLMLLGFSPIEVGKYYEVLVLSINICITLIALSLTLCMRLAWSNQLQEIGLGGASIWPVILVALLYLVIISIINIKIIRRHLLSIWQDK